MMNELVGKRGRVTPREVEDAFTKTGLKPAATGDAWLSEDGSCGCGLGAILAAQTAFANRLLSLKAMAENLQLCLPYICGFIIGWDNKLPSTAIDRHTTGVQLGYQDGVAAAQHMGLRI
jgi:hypothetical protein